MIRESYRRANSVTATTSCSPSTGGEGDSAHLSAHKASLSCRRSTAKSRQVVRHPTTTYTHEVRTALPDKGSEITTRSADARTLLSPRHDNSRRTGRLFERECGLTTA